MKLLENILFILIPLSIAITLIIFILGDTTHYFGIGDTIHFFERIVPDVYSILTDLNYVNDAVWGVPVLNVLIGPIVSLVVYSVAFPIALLGQIIANIFSVFIGGFNGSTIPSDLPSYIFDTSASLLY